MSKCDYRMLSLKVVFQAAYEGKERKQRKNSFRRSPGSPEGRSRGKTKIPQEKRVKKNKRKAYGKQIKELVTESKGKTHVN